MSYFIANLIKITYFGFNFNVKIIKLRDFFIIETQRIRVTRIYKIKVN